MTSQACPVCGSSLTGIALSWNAERGVVVGEGRFAVLPDSEGKILQLLIDRWPNVASKESLHHAIYGLDPDGGAEIRIIDVFICRLRKKIKPLGVDIETSWGSGYSLSVKITSVSEAPA